MIQLGVLDKNNRIRNNVERKQNVNKDATVLEGYRGKKKIKLSKGRLCLSHYP